MVELLKGTPVWFLTGGALIALWLLSRSIGKLDKTIDRFQDLFDKVFEKHEDHEKRLSRLEGAHASNHKHKEPEL